MQKDDELESVCKAVNDWRDAAFEAQEAFRKTAKDLKTSRAQTKGYKHLLVMSESTSRQRKILMDTAVMERDAIARKMDIWKTRCVKFARLMGRMYLNGDLGPYMSPIE